MASDPQPSKKEITPEEREKLTEYLKKSHPELSNDAISLYITLLHFLSAADSKLSFPHFEQIHKVIDDDLLALWYASQQRNPEERMLLNLQSDGKPVIPDLKMLISVRDLADYFMVSMEQIEKLAADCYGNLSVTSEYSNVPERLLALKQKRKEYLMKSAEIGTIEFDGEQTTLADISRKQHINFEDLYRVYVASGKTDISGFIKSYAEFNTSLINSIDDAFIYANLLRSKRTITNTLERYICTENEVAAFSFPRIEDFLLLFLTEKDDSDIYLDEYSEEELKILAELEMKLETTKTLTYNDLCYLKQRIFIKKLPKYNNAFLYSHLKNDYINHLKGNSIFSLNPWH